MHLLVNTAQVSWRLNDNFFSWVGVLYNIKGYIFHDLLHCVVFRRIITIFCINKNIDEIKVFVSQRRNCHTRQIFRKIFNELCILQ